MKSKDTYKSLDTLDVQGKKYQFYNLQKAEKNGLEGISKLPKSLKVLLENLLRYEDDKTVDTKQIKAIQSWLKSKTSETEIAYRPARVFVARLYRNTCRSRFGCNERSSSEKK